MPQRSCRHAASRWRGACTEGSVRKIRKRPRRLFDNMTKPAEASDVELLNVVRDAVQRGDVTYDADHFDGGVALLDDGTGNEDDDRDVPVAAVEEMLSSEFATVVESTVDHG